MGRTGKALFLNLSSAVRFNPFPHNRIRTNKTICKVHSDLILETTLPPRQTHSSSLIPTINNKGPALTREKGDLAEQNPLQGEMQVDLHVSSDSVVQLDGDIPRMLHVRVLHVSESHRLRAVLLATDAEEHQCPVEHLRKRREWLSNAG